jgi:uncharacterized membrane protein (DUF485 family)
MLHEAVEVKGASAPDKGPDAISWICTIVTLAGYLLLMLGVAYAPHLLAQPLIDDSLLTVGLAGGIFAILLLIVVSAVYTRWRNQGER